MSKKQALGKGVDILFGDLEPESGERFLNCSIEQIEVNSQQPRLYFDDKKIEELAESIREQGVLQPLLVRETELDGVYELIAGERRLRAAKRAECETVPVVVRDVGNDVSMLELALIENVQRTDLNPIEEAEAYQKLIEKFDYTQEEAAKKVGKQRPTVANALRLLKLPKEIQANIIAEEISEGHGRALLKFLKKPSLLYDIRNRIILQGLSVRQTEQIVKQIISNQEEDIKGSKTENALTKSYAENVASRLTNRFQSKIAINQKGSKGKIEIAYTSSDDLERLMTLLLGG